MKPSRNALKRFSIAAAIAAALSFAAHAQPLPGHDHPGGMMPPHARHGMAPPFAEDRLLPFLHSLKLSEAQKDKVFAILHAQAPQMREQAKAARNAHDELHELARSEQYDEQRARTLADSGAKAMAEMALLRAGAERQIVALLTPEQRQTMMSGRNFR